MTGWPSLNLSATSCAESKRRGRTVYGSAPAALGAGRGAGAGPRVDGPRLHAGVVVGGHRAAQGDVGWRCWWGSWGGGHGAHRCLRLVVVRVAALLTRAAPREAGEPDATGARARARRRSRRRHRRARGPSSPSPSSTSTFAVLLQATRLSHQRARGGTLAEQRTSHPTCVAALLHGDFEIVASFPSSSTREPQPVEQRSHGAEACARGLRAALGGADRHQPEHVESGVARGVHQRRHVGRADSRPCPARRAPRPAPAPRAPGTRLASSVTSDGRSTVSYSDDDRSQHGAPCWSAAGR